MMISYLHSKVSSLVVGLNAMCNDRAEHELTVSRAGAKGYIYARNSLGAIVRD